VIADCFQHSTVLPFRFGTIFNDDETLRKSIRSNQRQFVSNIEKVRGKTEMHLKIFADDCCSHEVARHASTETVGREYLTNLRESVTTEWNMVNRHDLEATLTRMSDMDGELDGLRVAVCQPLEAPH